MNRFSKWGTGLIAVACLGWYLISQQAVPGPAEVAAAVQSEPALRPILHAAARATLPPSARSSSGDESDTREVQPLSEESQEAFAEMSLQQLERIRMIPGAAPLLDDILEYLKKDIAESVSLDNIPTDEKGLAVLDDEAIEMMIPDAALRSKWDKLMALVAAQGAQ